MKKRNLFMLILLLLLIVGVVAIIVCTRHKGDDDLVTVSKIEHQEEHITLPDRADKIEIYYDCQAPSQQIKKTELSKIITENKAIVLEPSALGILKNSKYRDEKVLWKGNYLGVITGENKEIILIKLSYYGGFYSIVGQSGYYELTDKDRKDWEEMLERLSGE